MDGHCSSHSKEGEWTLFPDVGKERPIQKILILHGYCPANFLLSFKEIGLI